MPTQPVRGSGAETWIDSQSSTASRLAPLTVSAGTKRRQNLLATWATFHLAVVAISCLASVAPSALQSNLLNLCRPYLSVLHQDAEGVSLAISRNQPAEKTHELQVLVAGSADTADWQSTLAALNADPSESGAIDQPIDNARGPAGGCRQRRWQRFLARIAELGELDQAALAAWFVAPMATQLPQVEQLRIVRKSDLMSTVVDDNAEPPYAVAIVRPVSDSQNEAATATEAIQLLQIPARRLVAPTRSAANSRRAESQAP